MIKALARRIKDHRYQLGLINAVALALWIDENPDHVYAFSPTMIRGIFYNVMHLHQRQPYMDAAAALVHTCQEFTYDHRHGS